jgi:hypothetical protein
MEIMFSACLVDEPDRNARRLDRLCQPVEVILEIRHDHVVDLGLRQVAKGDRSKRRGVEGTTRRAWTIPLTGAW